MTLGGAIDALRDGQAVTRPGWNGRGLYLVLLPGHDGPIPTKACIGMIDAAGGCQPGWLASQADLLADDWEIVP